MRTNRLSLPSSQRFWPPAPPRPPAPGPESATVTGTVVERVDRALYSLLRLTSDKGQVLVALPMAEVERRMKVIAKNGAVLKNFESEQSRRKFEAVCVRGDGDGVEAERAGGLTA